MSVQWAIGIGKAQCGRPRDDARRSKAAGEEDEEDVGADVDDVERHRAAASRHLAFAFAVFLAFFLLAA